MKSYQINSSGKYFANVINDNIVQKLGISSGLVLPGGTDDKDQISDKDNTRDNDKTSDQPAIAVIQSSLPEVKKATENLIRQTDSIFGGLMLLTATISKMKNEACALEEKEIKTYCLSFGEGN
ncbi:hypothetical protein HN51_025736 [Arachis hypogaea]